MSVWIKKLKEKIWFIGIIVLLFINPLINVPLIPFHIYIQHLIFSVSLFSISLVIIQFILTRKSLKWKKAPTREIKVEDSVLLEGVGIFQGTLFLYLGISQELVSSSNSLTFLQLTIPFVTMLFYVLRGYGAIKDNPKHRLISSLLLIYYLYFEVSALSNEFVSRYFPIYVDSKNIVSLYFPYALSLTLLMFISKIHEALSIRYKKTYRVTEGTN